MKKKNVYIEMIETLLLFLILASQVRHTAGLYLTYTRLTGTEAVVMGYFIAITIEMLVVVFVYKGYRAAGAWFAIFLFFTGILFNENWYAVDVRLTLNPFSIQSFYLPVPFLAGMLVQFMSSVGIWYLTEIHVRRAKEHGITDRLQELYREEQELNSRLQAVNRNIQAAESYLQVVNRKAEDSQAEFEKLSDDIFKLNNEKISVHRVLTEWREEITSLKKAKPRLIQK